MEKEEINSKAESLEDNESEGEMQKRLRKEREILAIAEKAWLIRQKNRELEWFEMESKVRGLVYELVQPTALKCDVNKSECIDIRKDMHTLDGRIENLEMCLKVTKTEGNTVFDDLHNKILENEQKRIESTESLKGQVAILDLSLKNTREDWKEIKNMLK